MSVVKYAEVSMSTHNEQEEYGGEARGACSLGWNLIWREGLQLRKGANINIDAEFRVNKTCSIWNLLNSRIIPRTFFFLFGYCERWVIKAIIKIEVSENMKQSDMEPLFSYLH